MRAAMVVFGLLLSGCVQFPTHTLDDWRAAQSHHFSGVTTRQFEQALQVAFGASYPKGYQVRPASNGVIVERHWLDYAVLAYTGGLEHWQISYSAAGDGIDANADMVATSSDSWPPQPNDIERPDNPATYDLLWARISYVLGQRADWESCDDYDDIVRHKSLDQLQGWGMCGSGADDRAPTRVLASH